MAASAADDHDHRAAEGPTSSSGDQLDGNTGPRSPLATLLVPRDHDHEPRGTARVLPAPDVTGLEVLDALGIVRTVGLRLALSVWETKLGPWGLVLTQEPEPGARIRTGESIHAVVAGRPHRAVPDVRGQRLDEAMDSLRRDGLEPVVTARRRSRTMALGTIVSTTPAAGALVVDGSRVALSVSLGHRQDAERDTGRPAG